MPPDGDGVFGGACRIVFALAVGQVADDGILCDAEQGSDLRYRFPGFTQTDDLVGSGGCPFPSGDQDASDLLDGQVGDTGRLLDALRVVIVGDDLFFWPSLQPAMTDGLGQGQNTRSSLSMPRASAWVMISALRWGSVYLSAS